MEQSMAKREPGVLITQVAVKKDNEYKIRRFWMTKDRKPALSDYIFEKIETGIAILLSSADKGHYGQAEVHVPGEESISTFFIEPLFPLPKLVIAGAGHIGKALSHLGRMLDFEVAVIDDRREFANPDNLPDADHIIVKDIGDAMKELKKSADTYIVIVTRGHRDDAAALKPCVGSEAGYIGMIGSKGKIAKMHAEFIHQGWATEEEWSRIFAPVGLEIKSKTVEEIAVSIAAQLVLVKNSMRQLSGGSRKQPE
jgi:xanthine dehydrogenase accessory factor